MNSSRRETIIATVIKSWSTESRFGIRYHFVVRTEDGKDVVSTIPTSVIYSAPCGDKGRIHSLVGAKVELTGQMGQFNAATTRYELVNVRGKILKLTQAMEALLEEERTRDAAVKTAWTNGCPVD